MYKRQFYHHDEVTERLGVQFRYYNLHEFMDQTNNVDPKMCIRDSS